LADHQGIEIGMVAAFQVTADDFGIGDGLIIVLDIRKLTLRRAAQIMHDFDPIWLFGHFQKDHHLGHERARTRHPKTGLEGIECDHRWLLTWRLLSRGRLLFDGERIGRCYCHHAVSSLSLGSEL